MGVYLEAADVLSEDDWDDLRQEAITNLMNTGLRVLGHPLSDLIDAQAALRRRHYSEATFLLERALTSIQRGY